MPEGKDHAVILEAGLDSAVAASAGYAYRWQPSFWKQDILLYGKLGVPAAELDLDDSSVELGARTTLIGRGNLRLQVAFGPVVRNTETVLFSANSLGVHAELLPGYQSSRWGLMAELGYEKMLLTNLRNSDLYEDTFYSDAENGWYGDTAGTIRIGIRAGVRIGSLQLSARLGAMASERGTPHLPPFYGTIGTSFAF